MKSQDKGKLKILIEEVYQESNPDHSQAKKRQFARKLAYLIVLLGWGPSVKDK